jgi:Tfp pilus assembly protein PilO
MKLVYSKKILILALVVFVSVIVLDVVFTSLLLGKVSSINGKVKQLEDSSQERLKNLSLQESINSSKIQREKLTNYFVGPGNALTVDFTKYLESLASEASVTQKKSLNYEPVGELISSNVLTTIRYKFEVTGSWNSIFNFLQAIENLPKVAYLNGVSLNYNQGDALVKGEQTQGWVATLDFSVIKLK